MKAALFSTPGELEVLLTREDISQYDVIALTPSADYAAEKKGLTYSTIEDICDMEKIFGEGSKNFHSIEEIVKAIDISDEYAEKKLINSWHTFFLIKMLYDTYSFYAAVLEALTAKYQEIIYFESEQVQPLSSLDPLAPLSVFISVGVKKRMEKVRFICLASVSSPIPKIPFSSEVKRRLRSLFSYVKEIVKQLIDKFLKKKGGIILLNPALDNYLITYIQKNFSFQMFPQRKVSSPKRRSRQSVVSGFYLSQHFNQAAYIEKIFISHVEQFLDEVRTRYSPYVEYWTKRLSKSPPQLVLSTLPSTPEVFGIVLSAKRLGIPVVIPQHGGFVGYVSFKMAEYMEKRHADFIPVYGAKCGAVHHPARTFPLGSPACYEIYKQRGRYTQTKKIPNMRRILFISDALQSNQFFFSKYLKPAIETARFQRHTIDIIRQYGQVDLKLYPWEQQPNPTYDWIKDKNFDNCTNLNPQLLQDVLLESEYDLIVTDGPATTLLYAVATRTPIIGFYDKRYYDFKDEGKELLKKRIMFFETLQDFDKGLQNYLKQPVHDHFIPNDEFLFSYGLVDEDESPLQKWHAFLSSELNFRETKNDILSTSSDGIVPVFKG